MSQNICKRINKNEKGFTLIEMLVSISLFSIVLVVILGSIITIVDVNRKSQSLTVVMNDVNFAMEAFTRSIKTGKLDSDWLDDCNAGISCSEVVLIDQRGREVTFSFVEEDEVGRIERTVDPTDGPAETVTITSGQIDIDTAEFSAFYGDNNNQPRVLILIDGTVRTSPKISSEFTIQTSISQRGLDDYYLVN